MRSPFRTTAFRVTFLGLAWMVLALSPMMAVDRFVRAGNSCSPCDGLTWATAYPSLQEGINDARSGDTVYVSAFEAGSSVEAIYFPDDVGGSRSGDPNAVFTLKDGVTLKGGYAGIPIPPDPNIPGDLGDPIGTLIGRSKLSGDIGTPGNLTDNSLCVVFADSLITTGAEMDGFDTFNDCRLGSTCRSVEVQGASKVKISNGSAQGKADDQGGAIYVDSPNGEVELSAFDVTGDAEEGGGIFCRARKLTVQGGRIHDSSAGIVTPGLAGGIYFDGQEAHLLRVTIEDNESDDVGGGLLIAHGGQIVVFDAIVRRNNAPGWPDAAITTGGLRLEGGTQRVELTEFDKNAASGNLAISSLEIAQADSSEIINSSFVGDSVFWNFPGKYLVRFSGGGPALVTSCTFYGGAPGATGESGIDWSSSWSGSGLTVTNTIFNSLIQPVISASGVPQVRFSYLPDPWIGTGNIVNTASPFDSGSLRPAAGSPVIDQGNRADVPPPPIPGTYQVDLAGGPRFSSRSQCPAPVDIGAYERADPSTLCRADFNGDCAATVPDIFAYLSAYFAMSPTADLDGDLDVDITDLQGLFLPAWFAGCPP